MSKLINILIKILLGTTKFLFETAGMIVIVLLSILVWPIGIDE